MQVNSVRNMHPLFFVLILILCLLPGCGSSVPSSSSKSVTVALIPGIVNVPFYNALKAGAEEAAKKQRVTLLYQGPTQFSAPEQIKVLSAVAAKSPDVIVIAPCDRDALVAPLRAAAAQGIMILTVDTFLSTGDYTSGDVTFPKMHIGSDNYQGGRLLAQTLLKQISKGKIYLQANLPGTGSTAERERGFVDAVKQAPQPVGASVQLLPIQYDAGAIDKASLQTSAVIQAHSDLSGVAATDIFSGEGMVAALKSAQKKDIKAVYFDAWSGSINELKAGTLSAVIAQKPRKMGQLSITYALDLLAGKTVPKLVTTDYVTIDAFNVDQPEVKAVIYD
jgi:ribose transport system substrate-binding protein